MTTIEEWRSVPSNELLEASSWGRIRSVPYESKPGRGGFTRIRQMAPTYGVIQSMSNNYSRKQITFRRKTYKVASLVAEAFHGSKPDGLDVAHADEDSFNNTPNNLEYRTRKYNLNMPGIKAYHRSRVGELSRWAVHNKKAA